jgi:[ribosomal protein S5]-alanine N-acetyltransferase
MPPLETPRLRIRPFQEADLGAIYQILDVELRGANDPEPGPEQRAFRERWLRWTVLNYEMLAAQDQPPFGDRAIALRSSGEVIGACGLVPMQMPFRQMPCFGGEGPGPVRHTLEAGLYWAVSPAHQRRGIATEAARALIDYAFGPLNLQRILAITAYENQASRGVMRKLGMHIETNPHPDPEWMQVVAVLEAPG